MSNYKIIFTGSVGSGKSTAITAISDIAPVSTDVKASDMTKNRKLSTTVAMDYGVIKQKGGRSLHLYGTPGQERFKFMWDILTEGGAGLILLIKNNSLNPMQDLHFFINSFAPFIKQTRLVVGVTCMDLQPHPTINDYQRKLFYNNNKIPVLKVDARKYQDVVLLVETLLRTPDTGLVA